MAMFFLGTTFNGTFDTYFGDSGKMNIREIGLNHTAIYDSMVGLSLQKANYPASPPEIYAQLREQATLQCQAKKNPCNPSDSGNIDFITFLFNMKVLTTCSTADFFLIWCPSFHF